MKAHTKARIGKECRYCARPMLGTKAKHPRAPKRDYVLPALLRVPHDMGPIVYVCRMCKLSRNGQPLSSWRFILARACDFRALHVTKAIEEFAEEMARAAVRRRSGEQAAWAAIKANTTGPGSLP
jgi:hypothetical protein